MKTPFGCWWGNSELKFIKEYLVALGMLKSDVKGKRAQKYWLHRTAELSKIWLLFYKITNLKNFIKSDGNFFIR